MHALLYLASYQGPTWETEPPTLWLCITIPINVIKTFISPINMITS